MIRDNCIELRSGKREQEVYQHQQTNLNACPEAMSEAPFLPLGAIKIVSGANFTPDHSIALWDKSSTSKNRVKRKRG